MQLKKIHVVQHTGFLMEWIYGYSNGPEPLENFATMNGSLGLGYEAVLYGFY